MEQPLVSILVPIYNVEKYIERCIMSLMEQSYLNIEYIFVNDCTPDSSINILTKTIKKYPTRKNIKIIHHKHNKGLAAARNTGLNNCSGEWISFVDSDDFLEKNAIEIMMQKAIDEKSDIVIGDYQIITNESIIVSKRPKLQYTKLEYLQALLRWDEIELTLWGKLINARLFKDTNIRSFEGNDFGEDFAVTPRIVYFANKITFLNQVVYNYECSNITSYTKTISNKSIDSLIFIAQNISTFFANKIEFNILKKDLGKGLICMKLWIYASTHKAYKLNELENIIKKYRIPSPITYKLINYLLNIKFYKFAFLYYKLIYKYNHLIKK